MGRGSTEGVWDADAPKLSTSAASFDKPAVAPELAASWIGTREQCTRNRGSLGWVWGGAPGIWGAEEDFLQLSGVSGGWCRAAGTRQGHRDHLSAVEYRGPIGA